MSLGAMLMFGFRLKGIRKLRLAARLDVGVM